MDAQFLVRFPFNFSSRRSVKNCKIRVLIMYLRRSLRLLSILLIAAQLPLCAIAQTDDYEQPPINYSKSQPNDVITRLEKKIASGKIKFSGDDKAIARAVLHELQIPEESQIVVFSKTSFQRKHIEPSHPRALYFSDSCYVGWVPGGLMEVAAIDPQLGPVFYSFDPHTPVAKNSKTFVRDSDCLTCHAGSFTGSNPGVFARSVFPDDTGEPLLRHGSETVDYRTPFDHRWGGWYVTGQHGTATHRGNVFASERGDELVVDFQKGANVTNLSKFFDTGSYLRNDSDIVALMVFEHQLAMHNAIAQAGFRARRMMDYQQKLQHDLKEPVTDEPTFDSVKSVFASAARDVVDALLFKDEATLPDGIKGSDDFQRAFKANAKSVKDVGSLKDFSLRGHLFQNRCSYLIYSDAFLALPKLLKNRIYDGLDKALRSKTPDDRYDYLSAAERRRIVTILRKTHPELAARWR
jgi:hypothetical protein